MTRYPSGPTVLRLRYLIVLLVRGWAVYYLYLLMGVVLGAVSSIVRVLVGLSHGMLMAQPLGARPLGTLEMIWLAVQQALPSTVLPLVMGAGLWWVAPRLARWLAPLTGESCPQCGYSLSGLPRGVDRTCPECGSVWGVQGRSE